MQNFNKKADLGCLIILGGLICLTIRNYFVTGSLFSVNNYVAIVLWLLCVILMFTTLKLRFYTSIVLLLLGAVNLINFTSETITASIGIENKGIYSSISLNPLLLLLLIIYIVVNKKFLLSIIRESPEEKKLKKEMEIEFYHNKFKNVSTEEWTKILKLENDYPLEARIAINNIKKEQE